MNEQCLENWHEIESTIVDFEKKLREEREKQKSPVGGISTPLFRGHGNRFWKLETTSERHFSQEVSIRSYIDFARRAQPKIEAFTGQTWKIPTDKELSAWESSYLSGESNSLSEDFPAYEYLAYLRHHGFPSPLLDWTISPYIAMFFAFRSPEKGAEFVAIYAYVERSSAVKGTAIGSPEITTLDRFTKTHKRHFLQQSKYTICTIHKDHDLYYTSHEDVAGKHGSNQDRLWKFNIPIHCREEVLERLQQMNINAYSLFNTEESLLETIALEDPSRRMN